MLPLFLKPFFWSYNFIELDTNRDKHIIIKTVLDVGDKAAWDWAVSSYSVDDLRAAVSASPATAWNRKSLAMWENILNSKARTVRIPGLTQKAPWPY